MKTIKVVSLKEFRRVERVLHRAVTLASTHDPDMLREIQVLKRQVERLAEDIGVPLHEYRCVSKGKPQRRKS